MTGIKSPISELQELAAAKNLLPPVYTPGIHNSAFKYTCAIANITTIGLGSKKKLAKQDSAWKALQELNNNDNITNSSATTVEPFVNYIGILKEYAVPNRPRYEDFFNNTMRQFAIKCTFLGKETVASGSSKKKTKHQAARTMLQLLNFESKVQDKAKMDEEARTIVEMFNKLEIQLSLKQQSRRRL